MTAESETPKAHAPANCPPPARVAIVGAGNVGSTFTYALLLSGLAAEIVLIDANHAKAEGEAMDLNHTVPFTHPTRVWAGDFADCAGAAVTILSAGANTKARESRLAPAMKNAEIWREMPEPNGLFHLTFVFPSTLLREQSSTCF